ncbi:hypothetical protein Tco_0839933 [Tanacetum coccineum]|uniref:Uncharacterized protein n=1 Tax=Tanacetum coccineum TaxID=301880 RepID=A0ABQ5AT85_9ASTR
MGGVVDGSGGWQGDGDGVLGQAVSYSPWPDGHTVIAVTTAPRFQFSFPQTIEWSSDTPSWPLKSKAIAAATP